MDCVLAIDLGSASTKAVAFARGGRRLAAASRPMRVAHLDPEHPDWAFWDPAAVWRGVTAAVAEVIGRLPASARVRGLAVTGLGMDGVPVDEAGRELYPFISWHCQRTAPVRAALSARLGPERIFRLTGKQVQTHDTVYRLAWMAVERPELLARASRWLLIEDWLNLRLCGAWATDPTMASSTSLFDQRRQGWCEELIAEAGVPARLLPEVRPCGSFLGGLLPGAAEATGLAEGTPVFLGGHDYLCAALGEGVVAPGELLDVVGTWELVVAPSPRPRLERELFRSGLTVESSAVAGAWATTGCAVAGGVADWYRRELLGAGASWGELDRRARTAPPGARGALFLPHLEGAGSPHGDPEALGALAGLSPACDAACVARALFEGLAWQSAELTDAVADGTRGGAGRLVLTGGLAQSDLWVELKASLGGRPVWVSGQEDATALGAALLAEVGLGWHRDAREAAGGVEHRGREVTPDARLAAPAAAARWRALYPALKDLNRSIREGSV